jgi:hypothetical protein
MHRPWYRGSTPKNRITPRNPSTSPEKKREEEKNSKRNRERMEGKEGNQKNVINDRIETEIKRK